MKAFINKYTSAIWDLALVRFDDSLNINEVKWISHDFKDRWFADPFILESGEKETVLLVEDYVYGSFKATLSKLIVDNSSMKVVDKSSILELDTHLSFPFIIRQSSDIFVVPENGKSGQLISYRLTEGKLEKAVVLLDQAVADAVLFESKGKHFMLCTEQYRCNGNVVSVFHADSLLGKYYKISEITLGDNTARSAGAIFKMGDMLIRPAQVCNNDYGEALCFQELIENADGKFSLKEIKRIHPLGSPCPNGIHTFNLATDIPGLAAIDGFHYKSKAFKNAYFRLLDIRTAIKK